MDVKKGNIASNLLKPYRVKHFLQVSAFVLLAYKIGEIVPGLITISLGTWMNRAFALTPYIALVFIILMLNPSGDILRIRFPSIRVGLLPLSSYFISSLTISFILGSVLAIFFNNFAIWKIYGYIFYLTTLIFALYYGAKNPFIAIIGFFITYSFLWFIEGRLNTSFYWLSLKFSNVPEWIHVLINHWINIHFVMMMIAIGFIFFLINKDYIKKTPLDIPILCFLLLTFISVILSDDNLVAFYTYFTRWIFPIMFYYAAFFTIKNNSDTRLLKIALSILLLLAGLLSIQNALVTGHSPWSQVEMTLSGAGQFLHGGRGKFILVGYQLGPWIALVLPLTMSLLLNRKETIMVRFLAMMGLAIALVFIGMEMQRVVMLSIILMIILTFLIYPKSRKLQLMSYTVLAVIGGLFLQDQLVALINISRPGFLEQNPIALSTMIDRFFLVEKGWEIVRNNPLFGIGPGGFSLLNIGLFGLVEPSTHNIILETALESGIIPSILLTLMILYTVYLAANCVFNSKDKSYYIIDIRPWTISLVVYFVYLQFHDILIYGQGMLMFLTIGIIVGTVKKA